MVFLGQSNLVVTTETKNEEPIAKITSDITWMDSNRVLHTNTLGTPR